MIGATTRGKGFAGFLWSADAEFTKAAPPSFAVETLGQGPGPLTGSTSSDEDDIDLARMFHKSVPPRPGVSLSRWRTGANRDGTASAYMHAQKVGEKTPRFLIAPLHCTQQGSSEGSGDRAVVICQPSRPDDGAKECDRIGTVVASSTVSRDPAVANREDFAVIELDKALLPAIKDERFNPAEVRRTHLVVDLNFPNEDIAEKLSEHELEKAVNKAGLEALSAGWFDGWVGKRLRDSLGAKVLQVIPKKPSGGAAENDLRVCTERLPAGLRRLTIYERLGAFHQVRGVDETLLGCEVYKYGRSTGYTKGRVFGVQVDVFALLYGTDKVRFTNLVLVEPEPGKHFSATGDSGAPVWVRSKEGDGRLESVGMVLGGVTVGERVLTLVLPTGQEVLGYRLCMA